MERQDKLEKGAVLQRDRETYAIIPHMPGGICTPEVLRKIADVAEKYKAKAIKATGAQRLAIVGLKEEDLDNVWNDLGMKPAAAVGMCIRSIKFCPGTTFCRLAQQNAVEMGMKLDEKFHGYKLPSKLKIAVSGCGHSCAESWVRDIGLIGTQKGWKLIVGGNAGFRPMVGEVIAEGLTDDKAIELVDKIVKLYQKINKPKRLGKIINEIGLYKFKKELGLVEEKKQVDTSRIDEEALSAITLGMYLVGSVKGDKVNAQISNIVFQATSNPPTVGISVNKQNLTYEYIKESGVFSVCVLGQGTPLPFISKFGFKSGREIDKFEGVEYVRGKTGAPILLENCVAFIEAKVIKELDVGTHTIFIGEVQDSGMLTSETPMTHAYYKITKKGTEPERAPTYRKKEPKFAEATGDLFYCENCGYIYDPAEGDPDTGIKPGTTFEELPEDWVCPVCGASKKHFKTLARGSFDLSI